MGSSETTTTQSTTIPGAGDQERNARALLAKLGKEGMGQLGDIGNLASGNLQLTAEDQALMRQIQELSGKAARSSMVDNAAFQSAQLEDRLLSKGMGGASIEAVNEAMIGRQLTQDLDQSALQGQITSAQQLRQHSLDRAGVQLNANQLLLNQILGGAGGVAQMGLQERLTQATTTQKSKTPFSFGQAAQIAGRGAGAFFSGGASEAVGGVTAATSGPGSRAGAPSPIGPVQ